MATNPLRVAALLGIIATLSGCLTASSISPARYYTVTASPAVQEASASGKSLGIRPLIGPKPYKLAMAYTNADNRLAYFQNAEWADLPATMLNRALIDGLIRLGAFSEVDDAANMRRPDLIMTGELRRFEADYNRETPVAIVEMSCIVRDMESDASIWQGYITAETPLAIDQSVAGLHSDETLAAVAQAMTESVLNAVKQACDKIGGAVAQETGADPTPEK